MNSFLLLLGGIALLILGSDGAVRGSLGLAKRMNWPDWVAGMLLLALGTSLPELFVSVASAPAHPLLSLGNIMGSNAFNVGIVLGLALLWKGDQTLQARGLRRSAGIPLAIGTVAAFLFLSPLNPPQASTTAYSTSTVISVLFLCSYAGFLFFFTLRKDQHHPQENEPELMMVLPLRTELRQCVLGFVALVFGAQLFLDGALGVASQWGWNDGFAGYFIAALGTSAPELATSIRALQHKRAGVVFGNVLGSNAFNLLLVGGAVGLVASPFPEVGAYYQHATINAVATFALVLPALFFRKTQSRKGASLFAGFVLIGLYLFSIKWVLA